MKSRRPHSPLVLFCGNSTDHEEVKVHECQTLKHPQHRAAYTHLAFLYLLLEEVVQKQVGEVGVLVKRLLDVTQEHTAITNQSVLNTLQSPTSQH